MKSHTIPPENWQLFFNEFSRVHAGWLATIEVLDQEAGPQNLAQNLPLEGICLDAKGTRPSSVIISVGDSSRHHVNHTVDVPLHIREADADDGNIELQFEPAVGGVTLVHVRAPMA